MTDSGRTGAHWLVVKFVKDLRRQETVNVGVMVETNVGRAARFRGQRADGSIDGRQTSWVGDVVAWRGWIEYWSEYFLIDGVPIDDLVRDDPSTNFRVVRGGRHLAGDAMKGDPSSLVNDLFEILVEPIPEHEQADISFERRVEQLLKSSGLTEDHQHFRRDRPVELTGERGTFEFPYAWENGSLTVGYKLRSTMSNQLDAASFRLGHVPPNVGRVLITPTSLDTVEPGPARALERLAYIAPIDEVTPDELADMFRKAAPPRQLV